MNLTELTKMYDFTGRSVIVTGGAGILGGQIACALVGCGANIAIMDRDPTLAERFMYRIETGCGKAIVGYGDVLDPKILGETALEVVETFGRADCLINAAGGNSSFPLPFFSYIALFLLFLMPPPTGGFLCTERGLQRGF